MTAQHLVAVVVGAAQGIGAAAAKRLAGNGYAVVLADTDPSAGCLIADEIVAHGGLAHFVLTDVTDRSSVNGLIADALSHFGRVDTLVVAAGILGRETPFLELLETDWDRVLDVNLTGAVRCCHAALPTMIERGSGRIVLLSSWARDGAPHFLPYGVSKAGIVTLMRTLAREFTPKGILVNCVEPGRTITNMVTPRFSEENLARMEREQPLRRYATPAEIAELIAFLASDKCTYTSGSIYQASGGTF